MGVGQIAEGRVGRGDVEDNECAGGREAREEVRHQESKAGAATSDEDNFGGCSRVEGPRRAGGFEEVVVTKR